jgi:adenosylcobinamide-phosphate synthase
MIQTTKITPTALATSFTLDLLTGDPEWLSLHPVRVMGKAIQSLERLARRVAATPAEEIIAGAVITALMAGGTFAVTKVALQKARQSNSTAGNALEALLGWTTLALRSLLQDARAVLDAVDADDLPLARRRLSRIVGRDTQHLDEKEIARAVIETLAESTCDGIIAPLFYLVIGGAPLALAFKAISTLDSMIGHRDLEYLYLGKVAARVDDAANYLPARISAALIGLSSAMIPGGNPQTAFRTWMRDGDNHASPNAGQPEAAMAGALQVRLGGANSYGGEVHQSPYLGAEFKYPQSREARHALRIVMGASLLGFAFAALATFRRKNEG